MGVKLVSASAGSVEIVAPTTASNFTATMPAATGTVAVSGNIPAFSAYPSATQNITNSVYTKVQFNTEDFDTNSCFDTTNYRFTPTVAGYYQINLSIYGTGSSITQANIAIYKNGSLVKGTVFFISTGTGAGGCTSSVIYCNGSTDYIEGYVLIAGTTPNYQSGTLTYFNGAMVRSA